MHTLCTDSQSETREEEEEEAEENRVEIFRNSWRVTRFSGWMGVERRQVEGSCQVRMEQKIADLRVGPTTAVVNISGPTRTGLMIQNCPWVRPGS